MTAAIHGAGVDNVYIRNNPHWNPSGHRIAAEQLRTIVGTAIGAAAVDGVTPGTPVTVKNGVVRR
ncbi:MAG: hypothetical protein ABL971_11425 [Vicinamibacterales bacterium]